MQDLIKLIALVIAALAVTFAGIPSRTEITDLKSTWQSRIAGDWTLNASYATREYSFEISGDAKLTYTADDTSRKSIGNWEIVPLDQNYALLRFWEEEMPADESLLDELGFEEYRETQSIEYTIRYHGNDQMDVLMGIPLDNWYLNEETGKYGIAGWARTDQPRYELAADWHSRLIGKWDSGVLDSELHEDGSMQVRYQHQDENLYHSGSWEVQRDWGDLALVRFSAPTLTGFMSEPEPFDVIALLETYMHAEYGEVIITRQYSSYSWEPHFLTRSDK